MGCWMRTSTRSWWLPDANKTEIKIAVETVFKVRVTDVNTLNRARKEAAYQVRLRQAS